MIGSLEPAKGFGTNGLQHEALHIGAHFIPEAIIELLAAAIHEPGDERDVVDADPGSGDRGAEEHRRGVLPGPVVGPREAALDETLVDGIEGLADADDGACRQDLDDHLAVGEGFHILAERVEHDDFIRLGGDHRLDADPGLGGRGAAAESRDHRGDRE